MAPPVAAHPNDHILFSAAAVIMSLHTLPYRIMGPCPGDDSVRNPWPARRIRRINTECLCRRWCERGEALHLIQPGSRAEHAAFDLMEQIFLFLLAFVFRRYSCCSSSPITSWRPFSP